MKQYGEGRAFDQQSIPVIEFCKVGTDMKIETKIIPHTQYYVIPYSIDDLNNAVNHDSFIDIIQSAKPFVNTNDICVEEAQIMADNLPISCLSKMFLT